MTAGFTGGCLCGAVRFKSMVDPQIVGHCHCVDCRKSSGTGHCTHLVVPEAAFTVTGSVTFYERRADSGNVVSRGFCGTCGSPIYSKNSAMADVVFPRASVLDDPEIAKPQMIVYASRAPSWDHMAAALPMFATMPEGGPGKVLAEKSG
jgi:hypothetical protein